MKGVVKMYNVGRAYGFIVGEDNQDYFLHVTNIIGEKPLEQGDHVTFEPGENSRGAIALNVKIIENIENNEEEKENDRNDKRV